MTQKQVKIVAEHYATNCEILDFVIKVNEREIVGKYPTMERARLIKRLNRGDILQVNGALEEKYGGALYVVAKSVKVLRKAGEDMPQIKCEIKEDKTPFCRICGTRLKTRAEKWDSKCDNCKGDTARQRYYNDEIYRL